MGIEYGEHWVAVSAGSDIRRVVNILIWLDINLI